MVKEYINKKAIALAIVFAIAGTSSIFAEVFKPIQIFLPGNLEGRLITFSEDQKAEGSEAFKLPYVINDFRNTKDKEYLTLGLGNDSDLFKPFSYLTQGSAERELIQRCSPAAIGISPNDLEVFNGSLLNKDIRERVFTNVEAPDYNEIFTRYRLTKAGNQNVYFFNFIAPEYCSRLPLSMWSQIRVDNPVRSLLKLGLEFTDKDYSVSVVYGDKATFDELTQELNYRKGIHFLINVPMKGEPPIFKSTTPRATGNVYCFSVENGEKTLPILNIIPKNFGHPRTTIRMTQLKRFSKPSADEDFNRAWQQVKQSFHKPLRVIPTTNRPTTSANRISLHAHAKMLKYAAHTEVALIKLPKQISFRESVMTVGDCITRFPNDRIIRFRATETQIKKMFLGLIQDGNIRDIGVAGCDITNLGTHLFEFNISHTSIDKARLYTVATTENTALEFNVKNILNNCIVEDYDGMTLWGVWKDNLQSYKLPESELFE